MAHIGKPSNDTPLKNDKITNQIHSEVVNYLCKPINNPIKSISLQNSGVTTFPANPGPDRGGPLRIFPCVWKVTQK